MPYTNFPDGVDATGLKLSGTAMTATAAQLNTLATAAAGTPLVHGAGAFVISHGSTAITGSGTVPTDLTAAPAVVVASLRNGIGASAGDPAVVSAAPDGTGGSIAITVLQDDFSTEAANAGTVDWIALGTA